MAVIQGISSQAQYASSGALGGKKERSFAELYRQARTAQGNDNGSAVANPAGNDDATPQSETNRNRDYIAGLHDRVDTLRGEILARVITAGGNGDDTRQNLGKDIGRLNTRLETLRNKLKDEEDRLSGHLLDVTV